MRYLPFFLFFIVASNAFGQVYFNKKPSYSCFSELQIAKLPEPEKMQEGLVFFITKMNEYERHIPSFVDRMIQNNCHSIFLERIGESEILYKNYSYTIDYVVFEGDRKSPEGFSDTIFVSILADSYETHWSWAKMRSQQKKLSRDTVFTAKIHSKHYFKTGKELSKELLTKDIKIEIFRLGRAFSSFTGEFNNCISFVFGDSRLYELNFHRVVDYTKPSVKIGKNAETLIVSYPVSRL